MRGRDSAATRYSVASAPVTNARTQWGSGERRGKRLRDGDPDPDAAVHGWLTPLTGAW